MEGLKPSELIPPPFGQLFTMYNSFNAMQATLMNDLLYTDKSIVLSAPTGSGKTVVFELAIVKMLLQAKNDSNTGENDVIPPKAIYIAPIKALCSEKFDNWKTRFGMVGIACTQITGDTQVENLVALHQAQVVVSTPEKWDSLTRRWREFKQFLPRVQLFIIDEVHLLNEDIRGPIIETIVARMKSSGTKRFIVASATIPNAADLTSWIGSGNVNVAQYVFNEMERPVPLEKHVIGINTQLKGFQFDMKLNYQLPSIIHKYSEGKATLIFCSCRKSAEMAAFNLNKITFIIQLTHQQKIFLNQLAQQLLDAKLKKLVENGIAYHHAGLQYADRNLLESAFREGFLMVLLSTTTLAMGINLPAHLVVIKSTESYKPGGYVEYSESTLLQMIGRAGRPQYDTKGVAVVLTQSSKVQRYQAIMNGKTPLESNLHKHLTEHLNSEIVLCSIKNLEDAMNWIRSTYLYVRSVRNPIHYGFPDNVSKDLIEHKLEQLCLKQINALQSAGLVMFNKSTGIDVQATAIGKLMAKYYLCFETIKLFRELKGNETLQNIFNLIVHCKELSEFTLRVNEKRILNSLNKAPIRFPVKGRIKKVEDKISCIMQAVLGNLEITTPGLLQESLKMFRIGERVSKCLHEYVRLCVKNNHNGWYNTLLNTIIVAKCFHSKLWENSEYASKQLNGIGAIYSTLFYNAGKTTLKAIAETEARTIERILNKAAPFGDAVLQNLVTFPEYEIKLYRKSMDLVQVYAKQTNTSFIHKNGDVAMVIVGDSMNSILLWAENFDEISLEYGYLERTVKIQNPNTVEYIYGHVIHTTLVGVDETFTLEVNAPKSENPQMIAKKQTRLNVTPIKTVNDSILSSAKDLNEENHIINDTAGTRDVKGILKKFQYTKTKICHDKMKTNDSISMITNKNNNSLKVATIKPLNDSVLMDKTSELNTSTGSRIVQRKLTEYFMERKKTEFSEKKSTADFHNETDKIECFTPLQQLQTIESKRSKHMEPTIIQCSSNVQENETENIECKKFEPSQSINKNSNIVENEIIKKRNAPAVDSVLHLSTKKRKLPSDKSLKPTKSSCPMTLASFLGDLGQESISITSMLEKENVCPLHENENEFAKQQTTQNSSQNLQQQSNISRTTFPLNSKNLNILENQKSNKVLYSLSTKNGNENINHTAAPLNLSKKFYKKNYTPLTANVPSQKTITDFNNLIPSDEQFALWYEVAMKFQKLPSQAMSLKSFRHVYNKIIKKKMEKQLKNKNESSIEQTVEKLKNFPSSSQSCSFRLKLFPKNEDNTINKSRNTSLVTLINQNVMKFVLNSKCKQNQEDINVPNFDEILTDALENLEKELSH